jgi:endonuclease III
LKVEAVRKLLETLGGRYSDALGIDLESGREEEIFKWFLASILFGAPITEASVVKTYKCFEKYGVLTPERILETGWDGLVRILDEGGYTRYDFKTAGKLLEVMRNLTERYGGKLTNLYNKAGSPSELEEALKSLGKGVGEVTVGIFLRELRDLWDKAEPNPTSLVVLAAKNLGLVSEESGKLVLQQLEEFWVENAVEGKSFVDFETALLRLGKNYCRKAKCSLCPVREECRSGSSKIDRLKST